MIRGVHTMFYSSEPDALRAFLRDKLGLPAVDVGEGWLIFDVPEADVGCHPADQTTAPSGTHHISFYCDDVTKTVAELQARGVEFAEPIANHGYGLVTHLRVPGGFSVQLYQPLYHKPPKQKAVAAKLPVKKASAKAKPVKAKAKKAKKKPRKVAKRR